MIRLSYARPLALSIAYALFASQVCALDIHVCVDASGAKRYQNEPCAPSERTASIRSYEPKPEDPALAARTAAIQQEMDRRNRSSGGSVVVRGGNPRRISRPTPCQAAKAKRKTTLDRVGLKRDFDLLSRLDSEVWDACKGL